MLFLYHSNATMRYIVINLQNKNGIMYQTNLKKIDVLKFRPITTNYTFCGTSALSDHGMLGLEIYMT